MNQVDKIKKLLTALPDKDLELGHKFLRERNFRELKNLVDSAITIIENKINNEMLEDGYGNLTLKGLQDLSIEVTDYLSKIEIDDEY